MTSRDIVSIFVTGARDGVTRVIRRLCVTSIVLVLTTLVLFVWCFFGDSQSDPEQSEKFL